VKEQKTEREKTPKEFIEGQDFYYENGLMVLTAHFLRKRGYCCNNDCRHCPYAKREADFTFCPDSV
jgi:hypothetical protein